MKLCFDTVDELREFVKTHLKNPRGGKGDKDEGENTGGATTGQTGAAPPPLMPPPQGGPGAVQGFTPPQGGFAPQPGGFSPPQGGAFQGTGQPAVDPAVAALVGRIVVRIDGAIQSGQPADRALDWFRQQCGAEAASATLDQIKQHFLFKLPMPQLDQIAKFMAA